MDLAQPLDERYPPGQPFPFLMANRHGVFVVPNGDVFNRVVSMCEHPPALDAAGACMRCVTRPVEGIGPMFIGANN